MMESIFMAPFKPLNFTVSISRSPLSVAAGSDSVLPADVQYDSPAAHEAQFYIARRPADDVKTAATCPS